MFKKIKAYISLQRRIQHEVIETLATICRYLDSDGRFSHNPYYAYMEGHFESLLKLSEELRNLINSEKIKSLKIKPIMPYIVTKTLSTGYKYRKCPPIEFDVRKGAEKDE